MSITEKNTEKLIELKNIRKSYGTGEAQTEVLHGVELTINNGEFVAIMGASGSGKSTLMNIIGTLDKCSAGDYIFAGKKIDDYTAVQLAELRNKQIGFVFQSFNLLPRLNIAKNIERPMMYGQIPVNERQSKIDQVLSKVDLLHKKFEMPLKLSGGQQQRIAIARALVMNPPLILADEPTGALDSKTAIMVMNELRRINTQFGTTIILITHDQKTAEFADRIIEMRDGVILS